MKTMLGRFDLLVDSAIRQLEPLNQTTSRAGKREVDNRIADSSENELWSADFGLGIVTVSPVADTFA
jgi:hypothetical protein